MSPFAPITNPQLLSMAAAYSLSRLMSGQPVALRVLEMAVDRIPLMTRDGFLREVLESKPYPEEARPTSSALWRTDDVASHFVDMARTAMSSGAPQRHRKEADGHVFDMAFPRRDDNPLVQEVLNKIYVEITSYGRVTPASLCTLGDAYFRDDRYDDALLSYRRANRIEPHPRTFTGVAILYRRVGQLEDALQAIDAAIEMENGRKGRPFYEKGIILRRMDRYEEALACFSRAIRLENGRFANTYLERAITLRRLSRWEDALKDLDAAIRLNSHRPQVHCERARVLRRLRRLNEAWDSIRTALALNPMCPFSNEEWQRIDALRSAFPKNS